MPDPAPTRPLPPAVLETVQRYWGFDSLRPLQGQAIAAALAGRDSLVVLPTGGGKSLCYQVPPAVDGAIDVIVSPLISLMKDQVDGLKECGYPAACLYGGMATGQSRQVYRDLMARRLNLLFVSPERLVLSGTLDMLKRLDIRRFAVDEAHCISHWGHDFRPEYRKLALLHEEFPGASVHAFTATATERVRRDIAQQLHLRDPAVLVGCFDRPNLIYRILPKVDVEQQALEVIQRHRDEAVIVYCIARRETESLAFWLRQHGIKAMHYHAGMESADRHKAQEAFANDQIDVVVATVAFGMGIDRGNVRCVLHASMPKSLEHYQQETGRAGRDGLEAECVLLYSQADVIRWESLIEKSAAEAEVEVSDEVVQAQRRLLHDMRRYCAGLVCRHKFLSEHFGQPYPKDNCSACDTCLEETQDVEESTVVAQKILSCVARTGQRFGAGHIVDVLQGADTQAIHRWHHEGLSTYGLLKQMPKKVLLSLVYQLLDQELLTRSDGEYPTLLLNEASWQVMRGQQKIRLILPRKKVRSRKAAAGATAVETEISWEGADRGLADHLRTVRRQWAQERGVPPYLLFQDRTLIELVRRGPTSVAAMQGIYGLGSRKLADFGELLAGEIRTYCAQQVLSAASRDAVSAESGSQAGPGQVAPGRPTVARVKAFQMYAQGAQPEEVAKAVGQAMSSAWQYLVEFMSQPRAVDIGAWVTSRQYEQVIKVAGELSSPTPKAVFDHLGESVPYQLVRVILAHRRNVRAS